MTHKFWNYEIDWKLGMRDANLIKHLPSVPECKKCGNRLKIHDATLNILIICKGHWSIIDPSVSINAFTWGDRQAVGAE